MKQLTTLQSSIQIKSMIAVKGQAVDIAAVLKLAYLLLGFITSLIITYHEIIVMAGEIENDINNGIKGMEAFYNRQITKLYQFGFLIPMPSVAG